MLRSLQRSVCVSAARPLSISRTVRTAATIVSDLHQQHGTRVRGFRRTQHHLRPHYFYYSKTTIRCFETEAEYHPIADDTLESIQDAIDEWIDETLDEDVEAEISFASGVLTLKLPPHGTWVINKQTPNRQLWWSSPLSGPKRFEFDGVLWYSTKDGLNLGSSLSQEIKHFFPDSDLEIRV